MEEAIWKLFWETGLPEAYVLAKQTGREHERKPAEKSA